MAEQSEPRATYEARVGIHRRLRFFWRKPRKLIARFTPSTHFRPSCYRVMGVQMDTQARAHVQDRYAWERTTADLTSLWEIT